MNTNQIARRIGFDGLRALILLSFVLVGCNQSDAPQPPPASYAGGTLGGSYPYGAMGAQGGMAGGCTAGSMTITANPQPLTLVPGQPVNWMFSGQSASAMGGGGSVTIFQINLNPPPPGITVIGNNSASPQVTGMLAATGASTAMSGQVTVWARDMSACQAAGQTTGQAAGQMGTAGQCQNFMTTNSCYDQQMQFTWTSGMAGAMGGMLPGGTMGGVTVLPGGSSAMTTAQDIKKTVVTGSLMGSALGILGCVVQKSCNLLTAALGGASAGGMSALQAVSYTGGITGGLMGGMTGMMGGGMYNPMMNGGMMNGSMYNPSLNGGGYTPGMNSLVSNCNNGMGGFNNSAGMNSQYNGGSMYNCNNGMNNYNNGLSNYNNGLSNYNNGLSNYNNGSGLSACSQLAYSQCQGPQGLNMNCYYDSSTQTCRSRNY